MRIWLNPVADGWILMFGRYRYDLKNLFFMAINSINGKGTCDPILIDRSYLGRMTAAKGRITLTIPDEMLKGETERRLSFVPEKDRASALKCMVGMELIRAAVFRDEMIPVASLTRTGEEDKENTGMGESTTHHNLEAVSSVSPSRKERRKAALSPGLTAHSPNELAHDLKVMRTETEAILKSEKASPDKGNTKSDIMTERKVVEQKEDTLMRISPGSSVKPARLPGHHYIEADRYPIDVNAYADDPCADLSDRVDHDGYQNVTDCIVKTYMRANRYFTEFMDARRKGRDFDLAAAEREQPPVHSLDDIISQLIAGAAQRSSERKPSSDDIQKNLQKTLNRFMSGRGLAI